MPTFKCTYGQGGRITEIEARTIEEAAAIFAANFPSLEKNIWISKGLLGSNKRLDNPGAEDFRKKLVGDGVKKQKAREEALDNIIQKVTDGDAERLSYGEINVVVENFFAHEESIREQEADLRRRLYALTLTNSILQGLIQTTILSKLISGFPAKDGNGSGNGGNSMGKALVAASILTNQSVRGMAEDVEGISEGFGFDE